MEMKKFNYMFEIDILRNSSQNFWCPEGCFLKGLGVKKSTQTPCWLRPWVRYLSGNISQTLALDTVYSGCERIK